MPTKLAEITAQGVRQIACGLHHVLALSDAGDVYAWGGGGAGQLGLGRRKSFPAPQLVWGMMRKGVRQIGAGSKHSAALTYAARAILAQFCAALRNSLRRHPSSLLQVQRPRLHVGVVVARPARYAAQLWRNYCAIRRNSAQFSDAASLYYRPRQQAHPAAAQAVRGARGRVPRALVDGAAARLRLEAHGRRVGQRLAVHVGPRRLRQARAVEVGRAD